MVTLEREGLNATIFKVVEVDIALKIHQDSEG